MDATQPTTTDNATPTPGAANSAPVAPSGGVTGAPNQSQDTPQPTTRMQSPEVQAALKALEEKGVTVHTDAQMRAARQKWERERDEAATAATKAAEDAARVANGDAAKVVAEYATRITTLEADVSAKDAVIASLAQHVNADIERAVKGLSPVLREFDPGADRLAERMEWYAKIQKHPEALRGGAGGTVYGNGSAPSPNGVRTTEIEPLVSRSKF